MTDRKPAATETYPAKDLGAPIVRHFPERPHFLESFPDHPELAPLIQAFVAGNYCRLRQLEQSLRDRGANPELRAFAGELVERTQPHPTARKLLFLSIGFFLFLVAWVYMNHAH